MLRFLQLLFLVSIYSCNTAIQGNEIELKLSDTPTFDTCFPGGVFRFFKEINRDTVIEINKQKYKGFIGKVVIQDSVGFSSSIIGFISEDKGRAVIFVDTDLDGDIQNETAYPINDSINIKIKGCKYEERGKLTTKDIYVMPGQSTLGSVNNKLSKFHDKGLIIKNPFKEAKIIVNKDTFLILVINPPFSKNFFLPETKLIVIKESDKNLYRSYQDFVLNEIGDTLYLGRYAFLAKRFDTMSSALILTKIRFTDEALGVSIGKMLPLQNLKNIKNGARISVGGAKEKYTMIDFWGTWCGPCTELTEDIVAMYAMKKDKVNIIGVAVDSDDSTVIRYMNYRKMDWPNVFDDIRSRRISRVFAVSSFPTFLLIDNKGRVVFRGSGRKAFNQINQIINEL